MSSPSSSSDELEVQRKLEKKQKKEKKRKREAEEQAEAEAAAATAEAESIAAIERDNEKAAKKRHKKEKKEKGEASVEAAAAAAEPTLTEEEQEKARKKAKKALKRAREAEVLAAGEQALKEEAEDEAESRKEKKHKHAAAAAAATSASAEPDDVEMTDIAEDAAKAERKRLKREKKAREAAAAESSVASSAAAAASTATSSTDAAASAEPKRWPTPPPGNTTLLLFYQYVRPSWTPSQRQAAENHTRECLTNRGCTGRLRCAREGFNGTLTGPAEGIRGFCQDLRDYQPEHFAHTDFKLVDGLRDNQMLRGLKVWHVDELVTYGFGAKGVAPIESGGTHLTPRDWHNKAAEDDTVLIDVRNANENAIGRFQPLNDASRVLDPNMRTSTEFPEWVSRSRDISGQLTCENCSADCSHMSCHCLYMSRLMRTWINSRKRRAS